MNYFKILIAGIFSVVLSAGAYAQSPINEGDQQLSAGLGFSNWGVPIFATYEYCVAPNFTIGGDFSYRNYRERWNAYDWNHHIIGLVGVGNYHFTKLLEIPENIDLYAGANIGFVFYDTYEGPKDIDYEGNSISGLGLGIQLGGRYYFNNKIAAMLQLGGGNTAANARIGVSFRL
jgi:hypothetical protein